MLVDSEKLGELQTAVEEWLNLQIFDTNNVEELLIDYLENASLRVGVGGHALRKPYFVVLTDWLIRKLTVSTDST